MEMSAFRGFTVRRSFHATVEFQGDPGVVYTLSFSPAITLGYIVSTPDGDYVVVRPDLHPAPHREGQIVLVNWTRTDN